MKQDSKNYKVRCVGYNAKERCFTIGKLYDVIGNTIKNDNGHTYRFGQDIIKFLSPWYKFVKVDNLSGISRVIFNNPATIILWADGTKTVAKASKGDAFDPEKGFAVACAKKLLGNGEAFRTELAKWTQAVDKRPSIGGFKVGDRVKYLGNLGTVIALAAQGDSTIGVEFDKPGIGYHNCAGVKLKDGRTGSKNNSMWLVPSHLNHVKEENRRLTKDELRKMQGQKVKLPKK